jgi:DivIVA domain-containing protein
MADSLAPISSSRIATGDIARHSFAVVRRGYDTDEVRSYLQSVSRSIEALEEREKELREALADAEERAAHPVVDEATLTSSLGQHSAQILRHAHEEAARIVAEAQENAAALQRDAHSQVEELQARTETSTAQRVVEVERLVVNAEKEARAESERLVAEAVAEGEAILARAKDEGRALLEQVQEARRRVLADLSSRRRALGIQIEQLRAARDEMAASVAGVRDKVDGILSHLDRTDDAARAAAHAVGDQFRLGVAEAPHDEDAGEGVDELGAPSSDAEVSDVVESGEPDVGAAAAPSVDELFARIRAGAAETTEAGVASEAAVTEGGGEGSTTDTAETVAVAAEEVAPAEPEAEPGPDDALVERRDELLGKVTTRLSRSVKRALGDDQNRLLDRLRAKPALETDDLLGPEDEHLAAYAAAARGHLDDAFAAGTVFAGAEAAAVPKGEAPEQAASGLARVVVTMLRRQIAEGSGDPGDLVGATFREWRGERVERLAGDATTQAFSSGVAAAAGGSLRWVVTSAAGCSDCEDNALAGGIRAPETFPTGHAHPPAHAGCRCLVTPADD